MAELWNRLCLGALDAALGWLLALPSDVRLFVVAIGTSAILTFVRLFTTNQGLLGRAAADKGRLKQLIRQAKGQGDRRAVKRHRTTRSLIAMKTIKYEFLPLAASILPIAMLATWCFQRLHFHPPADGEEVSVNLYTPVSAVGEPVHLVPQDGLAAGRWVRLVRAGDYRGQETGLATWEVRGDAAERPHTLVFRLGGRTYRHELLVGRRTYSADWVDFDDRAVNVELKMREVKLFGLVPGIPAILCPPWLVAYLLIVIPFFFLIRRVFRIH